MNFSVIYPKSDSLTKLAKTIRETFAGVEVNERKEYIEFSTNSKSTFSVICTLANLASEGQQNATRNV
jgi:uncharacterized membrane protein